MPARLRARLRMCRAPRLPAAGPPPPLTRHGRARADDGLCHVVRRAAAARGAAVQGQRKLLLQAPPLLLQHGIADGRAADGGQGVQGAGLRQHALHVARGQLAPLLQERQRVLGQCVRVRGGHVGAGEPGHTRPRAGACAWGVWGTRMCGCASCGLDQCAGRSPAPPLHGCPGTAHHGHAHIVLTARGLHYCVCVRAARGWHAPPQAAALLPQIGAHWQWRQAALHHGVSTSSQVVPHL